MDRQPRRDAQRNRACLLTAARAVFDEHGIDASVDLITERAGLGTGTLYRHFPTREALVEALFEERAGEIVAAARRALEHADARAGLWSLLDELVALQRTDRVLRELMLRRTPPAGLAEETRASIMRLGDRLVARARAQGVVREDFTTGDLTMLFWSLRPLVEATSGVAPEAWRRHVGFVLDGLRPAAATAAAAPPLSDAQLAQATAALRARRTRSLR